MKRFPKTTKVADHLTGASLFAVGVQHVARSGKGGAQLIAQFCRDLVRRDPVEDLPTDSNDPGERFAVAMQQYSRSETDLAKLVARSGRAAWVYLLLLALLAGAAVLHEPAPAFPAFFKVFLTVGPLLLYPLLLARAFRASFDNYQLRTRQLVTVREFARKPANWFPVLSVPGKAVVALVAGLLGATIAPELMAQELPDLSISAPGNLGEIPGSDIFLRTLSTFLGGIGPIPELIGDPSPWALPLGVAFGVFNAILVAIGGAMLAWHTLAGMVATAQSGQVLGERWNTLWAPVRVTIGVGFLAPLSAFGGFSAVQVVVLYLAIWSGSAANMIWNGFTSSFGSAAYVSGAITSSTERKADHAAAVFALSRDADGRNLILNMFEKNVCLQAMKASADYYIDSYNIRNPGSPITDMTGITASEAAAITAESAYAKNILAQGGVRFDSDPYSRTPSLDLQEVATGAAFYQLGLKRGGQITNEDYGSWADAIEPRNGWFPWSEKKISAAPTTYWNYGEICGQVSLTFADLGLVKSYLVRNEGSAAHMNTAVAALASAGTLAGSQIDERVMYHLREAARVFAAPTTNPESIVGDLVGAEADAAIQRYYEDIVGKDGAVTQRIAAAYANYISIVERTRAGLAVLENVASPDDAQDRLIQTAQELGWASAGAYYTTIARMAEHTIETSQIEAEITKANYQLTQYKTNDDLAEMWRTLAQETKEFRQTALTGTYLTGDEDAAAAATVAVNDEIGVDSGFDWIRDKLNSIARNMLYPLLIESLEADPYSAMLDLIDLGHLAVQFAFAVSAAAMAVWGLKVAADGLRETAGSIDLPLIGDVAALVAGGGEVVSQIASVLVGIMKTIAILLMAIGLLHSTLLPLLPAIFHFFAVMGVIVLICEALLAAPLWMLWHIRLDGQELVNEQQRNGYQLAFNIFTRAPLITLAVAISFAVMSAMIFFKNEIFGVIVAATIPDSEGVSWLGILVLMVVSAYLNFQIVVRSAALIPTLPDRVLRWLGSAAENLGEGDDTNALLVMMNNQTERRVGQLAPGVSGSKIKGKKPGGDAAGAKEKGSKKKGGE